MKLAINFRKDYYILRKKLSHFWNRWKKEYMVDLREFHKLNNHNNILVEKGDLVLLQEDNVKCGQWKVGIVEKLYSERMENQGVQQTVSMKRVRLYISTDPFQSSSRWR